MRIPLTGLALVVAAAVTAGAQTTRAAVAPASKLWIEGTSNVHDWKAETSEIKADIELDAAGLAAAPGKMVKKVTVTIPVKSLKSGHGKMDENLQKALKADKNPEIVYKLTSIEAVGVEARESFTLRAAGTLSVAGAENPVSMDIAATRLPDGSVKATATVPLKMTAFGVKPPTAMLGAIKCGDDVKVKFDLVLASRVVAAIDK